MYLEIKEKLENTIFIKPIFVRFFSKKLVYFKKTPGLKKKTGGLGKIKKNRFFYNPDSHIGERGHGTLT